MAGWRRRLARRLRAWALALDPPPARADWADEYLLDVRESAAK